MRSILKAWVVLASVLSGGAASPALAVEGPETKVAALTRDFLDAYARGDEVKVVRMAAPDVSLFGGDEAEVFHGTPGLRRMLHDDHALWRRPASIGDWRDLSEVCGGDRLCVLTFNAPFALSGQPAETVRFTLVWRKDRDGWRLVQSSNATSTTGQSAEALLKK